MARAVDLRRLDQALRDALEGGAENDHIIRIDHKRDDEAPQRIG